MNGQREFTYIIQKGDNLYALSQKFETTVQSILNHNPFVNPYDLQTGTEINVYAGKNYAAKAQHYETPCRGCEKETALSENMRLAWAQHVYWTRMLLLSIAERLDDQSEVTDRLLRNPKDIADIFAGYYTKDAAAAISKLLTEHLITGAEIITALRDGKAETAKALDEKWYKNADEMSAAFSGINPYYNRDELQKMLYKHLDLTKEEVAARLGKAYKKDIEAFDRVEKEAMSMSDYFTEGIIKHLPQMFE